MGFIRNYVLQENALDKLFFKVYPNNTEIDDILIKCSSLNDFYSTNIFLTFPVWDDYLSLYDAGNNQFKSVMHHTHYVRDIWFLFAYFTLVVNIATGFIVYFSKKKYDK